MAPNQTMRCAQCLKAEVALCHSTLYYSTVRFILWCDAMLCCKVLSHVMTHFSMRCVIVIISSIIIIMNINYLHTHMYVYIYIYICIPKLCPRQHDLCGVACLDTLQHVSAALDNGRSAVEIRYHVSQAANVHSSLSSPAALAAGHLGQGVFILPAYGEAFRSSCQR